MATEMFGLKAYMGYDRQVGPQEGAVLIFARNAKAARKAGYAVIHGWYNLEWTDMAVKLMRAKHLFAQAEQAKLVGGVTHVIEQPTTCPSCNQWGFEISAGQCEGCRDWPEEK